MSGNDPHTRNPEQLEDEQVERGPEEADEDQLDEALEETFPASDPISP